MILAYDLTGQAGRGFGLRQSAVHDYICGGYEEVQMYRFDFDGRLNHRPPETDTCEILKLKYFFLARSGFFRAIN